IVDVLVATFLGDTAAYFGGRIYGRTPLAPRISPSKTLEGLVAGVVGGTLAFWFAGLYQDWLSGVHAVEIGALVALTAPIGGLLGIGLLRHQTGPVRDGEPERHRGLALDALQRRGPTVLHAYGPEVGRPRVAVVAQLPGDVAFETEGEARVELARHGRKDHLL